MTTHALPIGVWSQVDVDECKDLQSEYGVTAMPTFKMLKKGKEVGTRCTRRTRRTRRTRCARSADAPCALSATALNPLHLLAAQVGNMQGADENALREKVEALAGKPDRWASAGGGRAL